MQLVKRMEIKPGIGQRIRELRDQRGESAQVFATNAGVSMMFLNKVEKEKGTSLEYELLQQICEYVGTTVEELIEGLEVE